MYVCIMNELLNKFHLPYVFARNHFAVGDMLLIYFKFRLEIHTISVYLSFILFIRTLSGNPGESLTYAWQFHLALLH